MFSGWLWNTAFFQIMQFCIVEMIVFLTIGRSTMHFLYFFGCVNEIFVLTFLFLFLRCFSIDHPPFIKR